MLAFFLELLTQGKALFFLLGILIGFIVLIKPGSAEKTGSKMLWYPKTSCLFGAFVAGGGYLWIKMPNAFGQEPASLMVAAGSLLAGIGLGVFLLGFMELGRHQMSLS